MAPTYQLAGRSTASRQRVLADNAAKLGLAFTPKPSREQAVILTEMAWIRDGTPKGESAAARYTLPWVIHGDVNGRGVAIFMVKGPPGSVFACRTSADGPVVRVFSRYNMSSWLYAFSFACYLIVGAAAYLFLSSRGWGMAAWLVWVPSAWLGFAGLRHLLALMGVLRLPAVKNALSIGEGEFLRRFSVTCADAEHARRVVSPAVQRLMLEGDPLGACWWSFGMGWVSCVARHEPINQAHGKVMTTEALHALIDLNARVMAQIESEFVPAPPRQPGNSAPRSS